MPTVPQAPAVTANGAPQIVSSTFTRSTRRKGSTKTLWMTVRFRVCDDSSGAMLAQVVETRNARGHTSARTVSSRALASSGATCVSHQLAWRLSAKFRGQGVYRVALRVRDLQGAWSNGATRSFAGLRPAKPAR